MVASPARPDDVQLRRTPVVEVYEQVRDAVVNISSTVKLRYTGGLWMFQEYPQTATSVGSGFLIHEAGYVVTNWHVVGRSTSHKVNFANGKEFDADVVQVDEQNDIAILKIRNDGPFKAMKLGRSDDLMIGETAIAIGNPFGYQNTVTTGVVSALHRDLQFENGMEYKDLIQTDASINHGNSGGPLLNILGEVIGINSAIRADAQNIGFAIPVDRLRAVLPDILDAEKVRKVQWGLKVAGDVPKVVEVRADSPAAKAGVRLGDRLVSVNGTPVRRDVDFYIEMLGYKAGDHVPLSVQRDGKTTSATLQLTAVPKPDGKKLAWEHLGVHIADPQPEALRRYHIREGSGVMVLDVDSGGPADRAELRPGDLIVSIGRTRISSTDDVGILLQEARQNTPVDVGFYRFFQNVIYQDLVRIFAR
jgi:serine protease Do